MVESLADGQQNLANAQVKLVQQEKMAVIGRLVASVVHEMRNPLSAIKMNLRLLQRGAQLTENEKEHLEIAGGETQRLESMLQELLDYGKPVELDLRQVNISDIIVQILKETRSLAENGDVRVQFEQADNQPTIRTDPELLHRLLENLVLNAVQACRSGDTVSVEIEYSVEATSICVKDTGSGMTETVRKRLFDPFFTTREEGTGLGMSNVQKFVSVMGGTVSVESETGQGTKVTIHLPKENSWPNS
ncbi:MAG TPA: HAMP domain-containing histidine kinase [Bacteroidetes bacterium]|nr:HAMP domain-containing histidine kinase [Bacteroidota bacterium]HEX04049.1 HAMP domain-containing histidine kinase [Bacteroidota bacterium]